MSTQKREPGKNYVGLMIDRDKEQRAIEPVAPSGRRLRNYFLGLVATMFAHRSDAS
jgi:hypothetical protein